MKKFFLAGAAAIAIAGVAIVSSALTTHGATARYSFIARGIITGIDKNAETINVDVNKAVGGGTKAADELEGENKEFIVEDAKFFSYSNATKKDTRVTLGALQIGQEIGFKGTALSNDKFELNFVRIHDRSFTVVGLLKEHDQALRTMKILLNSSSYKPTIYKHGTTVSFTYPESATFYEKATTTPVSFEAVDANAQKIQVKGSVTGSNNWQIKTLVDHFKGN